MTGPCEQGNEPSGCIKCDEFLDKFGDNQILRKVFAPWS
jgi:hypothetical protein